MAKGNGGTRASGPSNTLAPTPEQILDNNVSEAIAMFSSLSPSRRSFDRDAQANIDEPINVVQAFSKARGANAIREGVLEGIGQMYDMYRIPRMKRVSFIGENKYSDEAAATSPDGKMMRFNTSLRGKALAKETAIHEMTHVMTGVKFQNLPPQMGLTLRNIYNSAKSAIPNTGSAYKNYWRTDVYEFTSVAFQKALTGQPLNQFEKMAFLTVHNHFKKKS